MHIELRHARIVTAIASTRSISKAAARLGIPQPGLTVQLRRIEKALGGDLFIRSHSGVVPTRLGRRLIPLLTDLACRADALLDEIEAPSAGVLRLGNLEWTPPTLRDAIQRSLPAVEVETETVDPLAAVGAVSQGELTAALVPEVQEHAEGEERGPLLEREVIVREPVWLALPPGHPLAGKGPATRAQLSELPWVRYVHEHWFHGVDQRVFEQATTGRPEVVHRAHSHHEAMSWVRDSGVAALTPPTGATKDVALVPLPSTQNTGMVLVWRAGALSRSTLNCLVGAVRSYYCDYARTIPRYWAWITRHPSSFPELLPYLGHQGPRLRSIG